MHWLRAPGIREGPPGLPQQRRLEDSGVSPDWVLIRRIVALLGDDDGLADVEMAERLGIPAAYVGQAAKVLYSRHKVDFILGYLVAAPVDGGRAV